MAFTRTHKKHFCIRCMRTNACSCVDNQHVLEISDTWKIPSPYDRKNRWKKFFKEAKSVFRREYLMTTNKKKRELIEKNYIFYGLQDVFEGATALRTRKEVQDYKEDDKLPEAIEREEFEISITEEAIGRYGAGTYLNLKFEMALSGDTYETLYLRIDKKENANVVKVYNRLVKKVKKITGYTFGITPVMEEQPSNPGYMRKAKEAHMKWVTEFKLPPGFRKISGKKELNKKTGRFRHHIGTIET